MFRQNFTLGVFFLALSAKAIVFEEVTQQTAASYGFAEVKDNEAWNLAEESNGTPDVLAQAYPSTKKALKTRIGELKQKLQDCKEDYDALDDVVIALRQKYEPEEVPDDQEEDCDAYITTPYADLSYESIGVWAAEDLEGHLQCLRDDDKLAYDGVVHDSVFRIANRDIAGTCEKHEDECHGDGSYEDEYFKLKITFYKGSAVKVVETKKYDRNSVGVYTMLNGAEHGEYSFYQVQYSKIRNTMWDQGDNIGVKYPVLADDAYYLKDGTAQNISADIDWRDFIDTKSIQECYELTPAEECYELTPAV